MSRVSSGRLVVTGATRGIGRAVVDRLLASGAQVVAVGRDRAALDALAQVGAIPLAVELTDASAREAVIGRAVAALGGLDGLVQCAGIVRYGALLEVSEVDLAAQWELNVVTPLVLAQRAAEQMNEGAGAIVHVASTLGLRPATGAGAYAATKAALISLTRSLALELAGRGIRVNAVAPGVVDTDMIRTPRGDARTVEEQVTELAALHPLGRLGKPDEVAEAIVQLLDAAWTTGAIHVVDGGLLAG